MNTVSQEINGLKLGSKIVAPSPWNVPWQKETVMAEIIGFRHYSGRNATCIVADYIVRKADGTFVEAFDPIAKILNAQVEAAKAA